MTNNANEAVTRDDAIRFLENACRNWPRIPKLGNDDIEDFRVALERFRIASAAVVKQDLTGEGEASALRIGWWNDMRQRGVSQDVAIELIRQALASGQIETNKQ